jgi:hypothetical protein
MTKTISADFGLCNSVDFRGIKVRAAEGVVRRGVKRGSSSSFMADVHA